MEGKRYVVVAPYVMLTTMTPHGKRLVGFFKGAPVPPDVSEEQIGYHLRDRMIEEVPEPAEAPEPEAGGDGEKPEAPEGGKPAEEDTEAPEPAPAEAPVEVPAEVPAEAPAKPPTGPRRASRPAAKTEGK